MSAAARSKLCSCISAWLGVFASIAIIGVVGVGNCFCWVPSAIEFSNKHVLTLSRHGL